MEQWIRFFLGTPQRFLGTIGGLAVITVLIFPGLLRIVVERFIAETAPIFGPLLQLAIVIFALKIMFRGLLGGGKSKRR